MSKSNKTPAKALAKFLKARRALTDQTQPSEDPDAAGDRFISAMNNIDDLPLDGPVAAFAKLYMLVCQAEIACPEEESGISFKIMHAALQRLRPVACPLPN